MKPSSRCYCILCAILGAALAFLLFFAAPPTAHAQPKGPVSFINDVAPILKESCFGCHGTKSPKGKFDLSTYESFRHGGTKGDPIVEGNTEDSYLLWALTAKDKTLMPPKDSGGPLPPDKIKVIEKWIKEGAKLDGGIAKNASIRRELRKRWKPPTPWEKYPFPVAINSMTFSPDGKKLVCGGHHELTVWDVESGKLEKRVRTRCRRALAMKFLSDGKLAVAGGRPGEEGDVRVYDLAAKPTKTENGVAILDGVSDSKVMVAKLLETDDEVLCLDVSPDGKQLAVGGCDRLVHIFDLSKGIDKAKEVQSFENHADWVFALAFSPDGKKLISGSRDKTAKIWDIDKKVSLLTFPGHQETVYGVAFSKDGKNAYSAGADKQVRLWNATGDQVKQKRAGSGHGKAILKLISNPAGDTLITCSADSKVRAWKMSDVKSIRQFDGITDHIFSVAVSPDGNQIAAGAWNGEVKVWNVKDGKVAKEFNASPGITTATKK